MTPSNEPVPESVSRAAAALSKRAAGVKKNYTPEELALRTERILAVNEKRKNIAEVQAVRRAAPPVVKEARGRRRPGLQFAAPPGARFSVTTISGVGSQVKFEEEGPL